MYVSIDVETTGLDPKTCQILQIGAVANDHEDLLKCSFFEAKIDPTLGVKTGVYGDKIVGERYALSMNQWLLDSKDVQNATNAKERFYRWLTQFAKVSDGSLEGFIDPIGQNFGKFDWQFLLGLPSFPTYFFGHRFVDVTSYVATKEGTKSAASELGRVAREYNIPGKPHEAVFDAWCTLALARENLK